MDGRYGRILDIVIVHAVIIIIQLLATRLTTLPKLGQTGLYLILMPMGFVWLGWDVEGWFTAPIVLLGVAVLLASLRKPIAAS